MLTVLNGGNGASACTITGLMKYTLYEFFIIPFYKSVEGKPSNSRTARTMEDGKYYFLFIYFIYLNIYVLFQIFYTFLHHISSTNVHK